MIEEPVGARAEEAVACDLEFLQRRSIQFPMDVGIGFDRDDVAAIEMGAGRDVFFGADSVIEPGHGVLLSGSDFHHWEMGRSGGFQDIGGESDGLHAALDAVLFAPAEEGFEECRAAGAIESFADVVADFRSNAAGVPPDRGQVFRQAVTVMCLEIREQRIAPVDAIGQIGEFELSQ